jgi:hypothetical protein
MQVSTLSDASRTTPRSARTGRFSTGARRFCSSRRRQWGLPKGREEGSPRRRRPRRQPRRRGSGRCGPRRGSRSAARAGREEGAREEIAAAPRRGDLLTWRAKLVAPWRAHARDGERPRPAAVCHPLARSGCVPRSGPRPAYGPGRRRAPRGFGSKLRDLVSDRARRGGCIAARHARIRAGLDLVAPVTHPCHDRATYCVLERLCARNARK